MLCCIGFRNAEARKIGNRKVNDNTKEIVMNRVFSVKITTWVWVVFLFLAACKEKDDVYDVNQIKAQLNTPKTREKSDEQYIAVLYADMFNTPISVAQMTAVSHVFMSLGDKDLVRELLISNYMNKSNVQLPSNEQMRSNIPLFVTQTYRKFLVRDPTEAALEYFTKYIQNRPNVTPELVYYAFASSNEYTFY